MSSKINFKIISNDGKVFESKDVSEIKITLLNGEVLGILANHLPLVGVLGISVFSLKMSNNKILKFALSGGIINVKVNSEVVIVSDTFENASEIDKLRVEAKIKQYSELIDKKEDLSHHERTRLEISLKKAINRISLLK
ncbi:MAG TPA: F0F1 ATP synthase subunit epsilon [Candidatus Onthovivens sp.]|nr:F0F1 ATP synthase subunit epsilon [Candidatus Onthovivens sp.]